MEHRDSLGYGSVIRPGDVQRMTAGTGITHSEFNHSKTRAVRFLQIWVLPESRGLEPGYAQKAFPKEDRRGALCLVLSRDGRDDSLTVHQDVDLYVTLLNSGEQVTHEIGPGRRAWVQVVTGEVSLNEESLAEGDGAAITDESSITLSGAGDAEALLFDLA